MKRLALLLLTSAVPAPALAQHEGHVQAGEPTGVEEAQPADPHAGHVMPSDVPPAEASDTGSDEHAAHEADSSGSLPPPGPPPAAALTGPENAADLFFPAEEMAAARQALLTEHGDLPVHRVLIDQLEARLREGRDGYAWDAQAWYGDSVDKLWLKSEGESDFGRSLERSDIQALWSHAIDPWFDMQLGVRQDLQTGPDRTYLVAGIQGLAPYWFDVEAATFLSNKGEVMARFEGEYDLRLTQRLILQPRLDADFALQDSPDIRVGSGLSTGEIGARLRYELFPGSGPAVIAPYVGVAYERRFGQTARYYRAAGDAVGGWNVLLGVRTWF